MVMNREKFFSYLEHLKLTFPFNYRILMLLKSRKMMWAYKCYICIFFTDAVSSANAIAN